MRAVAALIYVDSYIDESLLIIMIKLFIVLILNSFLQPAAADQPAYQLSPILPPAAFVGELYSCRFQVPGLKAPKFDF